MLGPAESWDWLGHAVSLKIQKRIHTVVKKHIFKPPSGTLYNLTSCSQWNKNRLERPNIHKIRPIIESEGPKA
uniref:Uncharacterized protein n=1 Tax=Romanomermis culicivorax TaxID=13658 RepID=A0A915ITX9_ROMCU